MLDPSELEKMYLESDRFWESAEEDTKGTVTGNPEIDMCLRYHLSRVTRCVQVRGFHSPSLAYLDSSWLIGECVQILEKINADSPLVYKSTETLKKLDAETVALEQLLRLANTVPAVPNVVNGKDWRHVTIPRVYR